MCLRIFFLLREADFALAVHSWSSEQPNCQGKMVALRLTEVINRLPSRIRDERSYALRPVWMEAGVPVFCSCRTWWLWPPLEKKLCSPTHGERLLREVRNHISPVCELVKQEAQHSFFAEDDKVRQSYVILSRTTHVFMVLTYTTSDLYHSSLSVVIRMPACLLAFLVSSGQGKIYVDLFIKFWQSYELQCPVALWFTRNKRDCCMPFLKGSIIT